MSSQRNSYNIYLEQFSGQQSPERSDTTLLYTPARADLVSMRGGKVDGSGRYEATYRLADGRIAELYRSSFLAYLMVWPSREAYDAYRTPMPFSVYHEM